MRARTHRQLAAHRLLAASLAACVAAATSTASSSTRSSWRRRRQVLGDRRAACPRSWSKAARNDMAGSHLSIAEGRRFPQQFHGMADSLEVLAVTNGLKGPGQVLQKVR